METRQRQRVGPSQLLESIRHQLCPHFNQGLEKDICLTKKEDPRGCRLKLLHQCSICACPGHGAHRCRDHIRDDSHPNPDNVIIHHDDPGTPRYGTSAPEVFAISPSHHTAQAAIKRDYRKHRGTGRLFLVIWNHSELLSARYKQYRQKQRNPKTKDKMDVWPDHLEETFQIGLRCYARRGRKKVELHGKQCGGNEFISNWIWLATGEWRNRKQISSHIQVLKAYMSSNPPWLNLLKANPEWNKGLKKHESGSHRVTPDYEDPHAMQHSYGFPQPPTPPGVLPSNVPQGPTIRFVKFTMLLRDKPTDLREEVSGRPPTPVIHHNFTSIQSEMGSAPRALESVPHWQSTYPRLRPYDEAGNTAPIFLFDANLSLMEDYPGNTRIEIDFDIDFVQGACYRDWHSRSQAYDELGPSRVYEFRNLEERESLDPATPHCSPRPRVSSDQTLTLKVPFRAEFWRDLFWNFRNKQLEAAATGDPERVGQEHSYPRRYLSKLSVMQELWASPLTEGARSHRMAILLWRFQQTHGREVPTTSWRRLTPPPASSYCSKIPTSPHQQPPINLDLALQPELTMQHPVVRRNAADYCHTHPNGFFSEIPEEMLIAPHPMGSKGNSPDSGVAHADDRSFPSSTSTSFPSSISGSTLRTVPSHQSSFDASEGRYPCLESVASHDSLYRTDSREHRYPGQKDIIDPQGGLQFDVQETLYHSQAPEHSFSQGAAAEYQPFDGQYDTQRTEEVMLMDNHRDFLGVDIKLAWAQLEDDAKPRTDSPPQDEECNVPMIAPRAQMVSQHQILQLEHYEELQQIFMHQNQANQEHLEHQEHQVEAPEAEQHWGLNHEGGQQQPPNYQELSEQWTMQPPPPPPWEEQQLPYQHSSCAGPESSHEVIDRWYENTADKGRKYTHISPLDDALPSGAGGGGGYGSPVTNGADKRAGQKFYEEGSRAAEEGGGK